MYGLKDIEQFFFDAMRIGYAANPKETTLIDLPGSKVIIIQDRGFKMVDLWFVGGNDKSAGSTMIFADNRLVWKMDYRGQYQKEEIDFLKSALRAEYNKDYVQSAAPEFFRGCRGPLLFLGSNGLAYTNNVKQGSTFYQFEGREEIVSRTAGLVVGHHDYEGILLQ